MTATQLTVTRLFLSKASETPSAFSDPIFLNPQNNGVIRGYVRCFVLPNWKERKRGAGGGRITMTLDDWFGFIENPFHEIIETRRE